MFEEYSLETKLELIFITIILVIFVIIICFIWKKHSELTDEEYMKQMDHYSNEGINYAQYHWGEFHNNKAKEKID